MHAHVEHAGLHAGNDMLELGRVCFARAYVWCKQNKTEYTARS